MVAARAVVIPTVGCVADRAGGVVRRAVQAAGWTARHEVVGEEIGAFARREDGGDGGVVAGCVWVLIVIA